MAQGAARGHTSATLRSLNSFARLQEMSGLSEKAGDRFETLSSPFNHVEQGKIVIPPNAL